MPKKYGYTPGNSAIPKDVGEYRVSNKYKGFKNPGKPPTSGQYVGNPAPFVAKGNKMPAARVVKARKP